MVNSLPGNPFFAKKDDHGKILRYVRGVTIFRLLVFAFLAGGVFPLRADLPVTVAPDHALLLYSGRREDSKAGEVRLGYSGARVRMAFEGSAVGMRMASAKPNWVEVFIDGQRVGKMKIEEDGVYHLKGDLGPGLHTVEIVKATEGMVGPVIFRGFGLSEGGRVVEWPGKQTRRIEFIGDSITCGYGIEVDDPKVHFTPETENFCDTYA